MNILQFFAAATLAMSAATASAGHFTFKDWEVACDNTRACEAVGYQADDGGGPPVTLWLGRPAGPDGAVAAKLSVFAEGDVGPLTLQVGRLTLRGLRSDADLTPAQIASLLPALLDAGEASVSDAKAEWRLSLAGMKAGCCQ